MDERPAVLRGHAPYGLGLPADGRGRQHDQHRLAPLAGEDLVEGPADQQIPPQPLALHQPGNVGEGVVGPESEEPLCELGEPAARRHPVSGGDLLGLDAVVHQQRRVGAELAAEEGELLHHQVSHRQDLVAVPGAPHQGVLVEIVLAAENFLEPGAGFSGRAESVVEHHVLPLGPLD